MKALPVVLLVFVAACSSIYRYEPPSYTVLPGDTLYSIAWRYRVDHRALAAWNGLTNPDRIYVGQRLVLAPTGSGSVAATAPPPTRTSVPANAPSSAPPASGASRPPAAARGPAPASPAAGPPPLWQWPVQGTVVSRFGEREVLATGIGIAGRLGQDVHAAAGGRVVYAGSGLVDYGQLLIIEHSDRWLSAYGHNQRLLVSEGQLVQAGQTIAEMGTGPARAPLLHFEIRREGNPVDPLALLPAAR